MTNYLKAEIHQICIVEHFLICNYETYENYKVIYVHIHKMIKYMK